MRQGGHDLFGARHLRHIFGMDEGDGLDPFGARALQPPHQIGANGGFQHGLFVLQAVARPDLDDLDEPAHQDAPPTSFVPVLVRGGGA